MAETTLVQETEVTPPNDEVLETPNPAPEAAPPAEDTEDAFQSPYSDDDILKEAGLVGDADGAGDGAGASADGRVSSEYEGKSAEEIERLVDAKAEAKATARVTNQQTQNYYAGVRKYLEDAVKEIDKRADQNMGQVDREWVKEVFTTAKGDFDILRNYDVQVAQQTAAAQAAQVERRAIGQAVVATLGQKHADELFKAEINDPKVLLQSFGEQYAKAKGYVPADKVKEATNKGFRTAEAKYKKVLEEHGITVAGTGPDTPGPRGGGTGNAVSSIAQYNAATMEQRATWDKADPGLVSRLIERTQARGG